MRLDPRERFGALAEIYERHRPIYPVALGDWIAETTGTAPPSDVLDVGCGTGKASRLFAERGYAVVGVDPSAEMLEQARRRGGARYERGESAATGRPPASADLIVSAQAFHWFDIPSTLAEFRRVLRPDGWCAAFWNERTNAVPFMAEYDALLHEFVRGYEDNRGIGPTVRAIRESPGVVSVRESSLPHAQTLDRDDLFGRVYASSYVYHELERREEFDRRLSELFDRYQENGRVVFVYDVIVIVWQFAESAA